MKVEQTFKIYTLESTVHTALAKMKITWKQGLPIPLLWNTATVFETCKHFLNITLTEVHYCNLVYIDETGFNLECKTKGYAVAGERTCVCASEIKKYHCYCSIDQD